MPSIIRSRICGSVRPYVNRGPEKTPIIRSLRNVKCKGQLLAGLCKQTGKALQRKKELEGQNLAPVALTPEKETVIILQRAGFSSVPL